MPRVLSGSAAGLLLVVATAAAQGTIARPGAVNFIEGQVAVGGKPLVADALAGIEVGVGQTLSTGQGKAEILLTPGAFLRVGSNSAVQMLARSPGDTRVQVSRGGAILEVVRLATGRLEVFDGKAHARIERPGIYEFHAVGTSVEVIAGKARIADNDHSVNLGKDHEMTFSGGTAGKEEKVSPASFDRDSLYAWSKQRSRTASNASVDTAVALVATNPDDWRGSDWYWNPFYATWAFLPARESVSGPYGDKFLSARYYHDYSAPAIHADGEWNGDE